MSIGRALRSGVTKAIGIGVSFLVFASGAELQSRASHNQEGKPLVGAVLGPQAIRYDVSRPLTSLRGSADGTAVAVCEGAGCGTSAEPLLDDPDTEQEKGPNAFEGEDGR